MSIAKVNPAQGEVVLPAVSNAFSVPPIQRSYTEGRAHEVYQSQTDAKTVNPSSVLTLEIPPCSSGQVYDLSQSHLKMRYKWEYAAGQSVSANLDAVNPVLKSHNMFSAQPTRITAGNTQAPDGVSGPIGTSTDRNYTTLANAVLPSPATRKFVKTGAAGAYGSTVTAYAATPAAGDLLTVQNGTGAAPAAGTCMYLPLPFMLDTGGGPAGAATPQGDPLLVDEGVFKVEDARGNAIDLILMNSANYSLTNLKAVCHALDYTNPTIKMGIFIGANGTAGQAGAVATPARDNGWTTIKFRRVAPASAADTSVDKVLSGVSTIIAAQSGFGFPANVVLGTTSMNQAWPDDEIIGRHVVINGEIIEICQHPEFEPDSAGSQEGVLVYNGCKRAQLGTRAPGTLSKYGSDNGASGGYVVGTAVTVLNRAEVEQYEALITTKVGWTDRIWRECTYELNSVSVMESDPRYGIAQQVRSLMEQCGSEMRANADMTGYHLEDFKAGVQDGLVAGSADNSLTDISRIRPDSAWHKRRDAFLTSSLLSSVGDSQEASDGPIKELLFSPALWKDVQLLPDGVTQVLRFTRGTDEELLCGPMAFGDMPDNLLGKFPCQPPDLTINDGTANAYTVRTASPLQPVLRILSVEACMKKNILSAVTNAAFLKHLAGDDLKLNSPLRRHFQKRFDAGTQSIRANQILPGPKPELVVCYLMHEDAYLGKDNDGKKWGVESPFKQEVHSGADLNSAGVRTQIKSMSISTAGQQYPFRRIEILQEDAGGRGSNTAGGSAKHLALPRGYQELYRAYREACIDPKDPPMDFRQFCQNPLFVFETNADQSLSFPDPIIMQTSVSVDIELNQQIKSPHILGVYTCSQQAITIDAQRRVIVG